MSMLKVVADENIALLEEFFSDIAMLDLRSGRTLSPMHIQEADALLVRSVTPVNTALLQGSPVRFVGSCTIGTDHMNVPQLQELGIGYGAAPGCNADSVVDYVLSALCALDVEQTGEWMQKTVGIVGLGNVGWRLHQCLQRLGVHCLTCDPLQSACADFTHTPLDTVLAEADIVSLHTPLTHQGDHATYHLLSTSRLKQLRKGAVLINSARGAVIDTQALLAQFQQGSELTVVLDVWENEPDIDCALLDYVRLATPHIAGYSLEGKSMGTAMIYQQLCAAFAIPPKVVLADVLPQAPSVPLPISHNPYAVLNQAVASVYDIRVDDAAFRAMIQSALRVSEGFDRLRKTYPLRREFASTLIKGAQPSAVATRLLRAVGFEGG